MRTLEQEATGKVIISTKASIFPPATNLVDPNAGRP